MSERDAELRIEEWQQAEAAETTPHWTGDLSDDCTASWAGLYLRAEWMNGTSWWWSVIDARTKTEIDSSNRQDQRFESSPAARAAAEKAAARFLKL